ncbi:MAG: right-handed parallel beta-helix repeat-containing protein [Planctomycetia bacterium]|nr:right-handed parallel beta-helix repeat-containing protein [Planctomycetia bacterium]
MNLFHVKTLFPLLWFFACALPAFSQNAALDDARKEKIPDFFVSLEGNDAWSGTLPQPLKDRTDGPFASLEKARDAARSKAAEKNTSVVIQVQSGLYELNQTFQLSHKDSPPEGTRVTWRGEPGGVVRLVGGRFLNQWTHVDDPDVKKLFEPDVCEKIIVVDLKSMGIENYGSPKGGGIQLYFRGKPMTLARYPNEEFIKITSLSGGHPIDVRGTKGDAHGDFQFADDHLATLSEEKDLWVHGYWFWDWAEQRHPVASIDATTKTLKVEPPYHSYGYRVGQWFYAYNSLREIDMPGEFYVDREKGVLYFYPPEEVEENSMVVSILDTIWQMKDVSRTSVQGFVFEFCRSNAVVLQGGEENLVVGCTIRNASGSGISASGKNQTIFGCSLYNLGKGGISMGGGDRKTLTPANNLVMNNDIHDYALIQRVYASGISISGVGIRVANNKIYNAPHMGIGFSGNDHLMEFNEIYNVCFESNDAGAIYTGRNWSMRGNVLRFNYLHDIRGFENRGCVGIYLDDQFSSAEMFGNIFKNVSRATMIGGGRDNKIVNNIYINCAPCVHLDARGRGWQKYFTQNWIQSLEETGVHLGIKIFEPPYSEKYPELMSILEKHPGTPVDNIVARNICVGGSWDGTNAGQWRGRSIWNEADQFNTIESNLVDEDPLFEDAENGNFTLRPESPALKMGFEQIPWEKIGTFADPLQAKP